MKSFHLSLEPSRSLILCCLVCGLFLSGWTNRVFGQEFERYRILVPDDSIASRFLGYSRHYSVYVPNEWQADLDRDFPLILLFDRQNQTATDYLLHTIDYMTSNDQMPACVILSLGSNGHNYHRETMHELSVPAGRMTAHGRFVMEELLPLASEKFKTGDFRMMIGLDRSAYFATAMLAKHWSDWNAVLAFSPIFLEKNVDLTDSLEQAARQPGRGVRYYRYVVNNERPEGNARMDSVLQNMGPSSLDAHSWYFPQADYNVSPALVAGQALYEIFSYWSMIQQAYLAMEGMSMFEIFNMEVQVQKHYGAPLHFAMDVLFSKAMKAQDRKDYREAIDAWDNLLVHYPNCSFAYLAIADAVRELEGDWKKVLYTFLENLDGSVLYTEEQKAELRKLAEDALQED